MFHCILEYWRRLVIITITFRKGVLAFVVGFGVCVAWWFLAPSKLWPWTHHFFWLYGISTCKRKCRCSALDLLICRPGFSSCVRKEWRPKSVRILIDPTRFQKKKHAFDMGLSTVWKMWQPIFRRPVSDIGRIGCRLVATKRSSETVCQRCYWPRPTLSPPYSWFSGKLP